MGFSSINNERVKLVALVSVIVLFILLILNILKIDVNISGRIEASSVSFKLENGVTSFLSGGVGNRFKEIGITSFSQGSVYYDSANENEILRNKSGHLIIKPDDITSLITFKSISLINLDLNPGSNINMTVAVKEPLKGSLRITNQDRGIVLAPLKKNINMFISDAILMDGTRKLSTFENKNVDLSVDTNKLIKFLPRNDDIKIHFAFENKTEYIETDLIIVKNLGFIHEDEENLIRSSVLGGEIYIEETNKKLKLIGNRFLQFDKNDVFEISSLKISDGKIIIQFDGKAKHLLIGSGEDKYLPSILQYMGTNQFYVTLLNSYLIIITFFIAVTKKEA